jgi:hypothetical protein
MREYRQGVQQRELSTAPGRADFPFIDRHRGRFTSARKFGATRVAAALVRMDSAAFSAALGECLKGRRRER